jgi:hypothetical protein
MNAHHIHRSSPPNSASSRGQSGTTAGVVGNRAWFLVWEHLRHPRLEGVAVGFERGQVAYLRPARGDVVFLEKQAVGTTGLASMDAQRLVSTVLLMQFPPASGLRLPATRLPAGVGYRLRW